jgi:hypothetical protein
MDLKRLITRFSYQIEAKPDGGFVARASDPSVPPLEASTRAELQQKIQQNIVSALSAEFPALKLPLERKTTELTFHLERKPDGGFALHSADPNSGVIEASTQEGIESHFVEKFLGFAGQHLMPELSQALAAQISSGNISRKRQGNCEPEFCNHLEQPLARRKSWRRAKSYAGRVITTHRRDHPCRSRHRKRLSRQLSDHA